MFKKLFQYKKNSGVEGVITIVSGLPRSGTSLMMNMLEAGGMDVLTDKIRTPDGDNPRGYFEYERVKGLKAGDIEWITEARGKVVKIIAALIPYLPNVYTYRIIFMRRALSEILASQRNMLVNRGEDPTMIDDKMMARIYDKHLKQVDSWIDTQSNLQCIDITYNELLIDPDLHITRINEFMGEILDVEQMKSVIDPSLYRQRNAGTENVDDKAS
jgi:hypothetical protein